ncbi:MAG TPA: PP2C family protein-serine/threonine phosphatase [Chitinophagales bacterium]|nr:PP2C family protein-serine/threonine phosphatase [Chitinophagales bacterium]
MQKEIDLERLLQLKEQQQNSLLQVTQAINGNMSARGLLKLYKNILVKNLNVKKVALFIHNVGWMCTNAHGISPQEAEDLILKYLPSFKQITDLKKTKHEIGIQFQTVLPVYHRDIPLAFTFIDSLNEDHGLIEEQLNYIQTISSVIAVAIENKKLFRTQIKQRFFKSEMEMAGQMQVMLIPGTLPNDERISMAGTYLPHQEVGGDYYDYFELSDDECIFCIADISGKGMAAALLMASFQASLRSYAEKELSLHKLIENLNARVNDITKGEKFITLFLAKYHHPSRTLSYVNAGHNPSILFHNKETKLLQEGCTILGMFEKLPYINVQEIYLPEEFLVFCYTDGLIEIHNDENEMLDIGDLVSFVEKNHDLPPVKLNKAMVDHIVSFKGAKMIDDDISLLTCKVFSNSHH